MTPAVLDASAAVEIALNSTRGQYLDSLLSGRHLHVPELFYSECGAALRRMQLHGDITAVEADRALTHVLSLRADRAMVLPLLPLAWPLRANLTVPDAIYVVLAQQLQAPLFTGDKRLTRAPANVLNTIEMITAP